MLQVSGVAYSFLLCYIFVHYETQCTTLEIFSHQGSREAIGFREIHATDSSSQSARSAIVCAGVGCFGEARQLLRRSARGYSTHACAHAAHGPERTVVST